MAWFMYLVMLLQSMVLVSTQAPITPSSFNFSPLGVLAANGSSAVGGCSNVTSNLDQTSTCNDPSSSVLFDGNIPTLAALDGDTWASQLMILSHPEFGSSIFHMDFALSASIGRVEVTIFNCPQWGTGVEYITVSYFTSNYRLIRAAWPTVISCTSLLKVCIPFQVPITSTLFRLYFNRYIYMHQVHIAEIAFYSSSTSCPLFTTIPGNWTPPTPTEEVQDFTQMQNSVQTEETSATNSDMTASKSTTQAEDTLLIATKAQESIRVDSSVITVIAVFVAIMTLQTTVILIVVIVIACRRKSSTAPREKLTPTTTTTGGVYETVDIEMAPEYPAHGRNAHGYGHEREIEFKKNESYEIPK